MINLTVLTGELSSSPEIRLLESGSRLATLSVRVREGEEPATSVPVTIWDPPTHIEALEPGDAVLVVGRVRRRFFAVPDGRRGSRVEVVADDLVGPADRRRLAAVGRRAQARLDTALGRP